MAALLGVGPASATAWIAVPDQETVGFNPCTGEEVALLLHDVRLLVSGPGAGHEGLKFKGRFTTGDGFSGAFHDQDQFNAVPRAGDEVHTHVLLFRGADDTGRRVVFTAVAHRVDRDGVAIDSGGVTQARCVGRR